MVDFAGWEMPVQYKSILEEHKVVRRAAGLFDVSHMGEVDVRGPQAAQFLDYLVTNDIKKLFPGRVLYTVMCYPNGGVVDDLLVYMRGANDYFLCINAGNVEKDVAWIKQHAEKFDVVITDRSADYALLAIQGPKAAQIVQSLTGAKLDLVKYYHFVEGTVAGERTVKHGVTIIGASNLARTLAADSSALFARNLYNFLSAFWDKDEGGPVLPDDDEIVKGTQLTKGGKLVHERLTQ